MSWRGDLHRQMPSTSRCGEKGEEKISAFDQILGGRRGIRKPNSWTTAIRYEPTHGEYSGLHPTPDGKTFDHDSCGGHRARGGRSRSNSSMIGHTLRSIAMPGTRSRPMPDSHERRGRSPSPTSTTPSSPNSTCPRWNPSGSPPLTAPGSKASSSARPASILPRSIPSSFSSTAGRRGRGTSRGRIAGTRSSSPPTATWWS